MIFIAQSLILAATLCAVLAGSYGALLFAGRAMNRARPGAVRAKAGLMAGLCIGAIVAAGAAGFWGAGALLYLASR
jgi:hypothetical protein